MTTQRRTLKAAAPEIQLTDDPRRQALAESQSESVARAGAPLPKPKPKAYSYIRMSTKEQLQGDSLRRQLARMRQYVAERDLELVDNYADIGVSGYREFNATHGELRAFINAVDEGDVPRGSYLIIESMDRLSRATAMTAFALMCDLIDKGITLVTLDSGLEFSHQTSQTNHANLFIAIGEMIRAHEESRRKSELLSYVWEEKRHKLRTIGKPITSKVPAWLRLSDDGTTIEAIPERAHLVKEIFDLACNGYGTYSIARTLNDGGIPAWGMVKQTKARARTAAKLSPIWRESYIKKIIANRAVLGEFQPHRQEVTSANVKLRIPDGEPIKGYYPRVVADELFRSANLAVERRQSRSRGRKGSTYANLFTGLLFCSQCGSGMRYIDKGPPPKGGRYLRCSRTVTTRDCVSKVYRYDVIEQTILAFLETLDVERVLGGPPLARRIAEKRHAADILGMQVAGLDQQISYTVGAITKGASPELVKSLREMERDRGEKSAALARLHSEIADAESLDPAARKASLRRLLESIGADIVIEDRTRARRALAAELQRILDRMTIKPAPAFSFEEDEVHASWKRSYERSPYTRLQKYLNDYGFELSIHYRNGLQQLVGGFDETSLRLKWDIRFRNLKLISEIEER